MQKTIYIAGKITGLDPEQVRVKFEAATERLAARDDVGAVLNPDVIVRHNGWQHLSWHEIMRMCIALVAQCDELHLLPCWQDSKGATLERNTALALGIPIVYPE